MSRRLLRVDPWLGEKILPTWICVLGTVHNFGAELIESSLLPATQPWGPTLVLSGGIPVLSCDYSSFSLDIFIFW